MTASASNNFAQRLAEGQQREAYVFDLLTNTCENLVIPLANIAPTQAGGPRMVGNTMAVILPDFQLVQKLRVCAADSKGKQGASFTYTTGQFEHGFGLRLYRHYTVYKERTGQEVIIIIPEYNTGEVLAASLTRLGEPRIYHGNKMDRGGMVFWPRKAFRVWRRGKCRDLPLFRDIDLPPTLAMTELDDPDV